MSIDIKHCYLSALYYTAKEVTVGWMGGGVWVIFFVGLIYPDM